MGGKVSTDFKSSNRIEISRLVQVLLNFDWFWGSPRGWGWVDVFWGVVRGCPHTHAHACTCMHAHACTYDIIGNSQGFPQWGSHLHEIIMFTMCVCVCMHVRAYTCMCMCVGAPPSHPHSHPPIPLPPEPQGKFTLKFKKSWTNWDNSILFEDSLPLNIPELI